MKIEARDRLGVVQVACFRQRGLQLEVEVFVDVALAVDDVESGTNRCSRVADVVQRPVDVVTLESRQQVHQVNLDGRVLAAHAIDQVRHHLFCDDILDDGKQRSLFLRFEFVGPAQQLVHAEVVLVNLQYLDQCGLGDFVLIEEIEQRKEQELAQAKQALEQAEQRQQEELDQTKRILEEAERQKQVELEQAKKALEETEAEKQKELNQAKQALENAKKRTETELAEAKEALQVVEEKSRKNIQNLVELEKQARSEAEQALQRADEESQARQKAERAAEAALRAVRLPECFLYGV